MTELEGSRNPAVGPFSYSPKLAQKNIVDQVPWEKMGARFKDSPEKDNDRSKTEISRSRSPPIHPQNVDNFKIS